MKRAIIYARVSTEDQAEHGYSLQSQFEACRAYAERNHLAVVAEIQDDMSGAKLARPGLDDLRDRLDSGVAEAVIVFSPDRLTRNLAHSLVLREEWMRAGIELHYCNRGKSENTPESRMTENIEAVFGDYWRAKIIEASARGRRTKAANGKWPGDGHAPYGYRKEGKGREAHLVIDEAETAVVQRIFDLYVGADGRPLNLQTIAAALTAERVPPPNRGVGRKHPGQGWHRNTVRKLIRRRAYIGELHYGKAVIRLPELAIIDPLTFEAAQKRSRRSRAVAHFEHKYGYLLAGHIRCTCSAGMSGDSMGRGRYLYYACNQELNRRHTRTCRERRVRADAADPLVWDWIAGLLSDPAKLRKGLQEMTERSEAELAPTRARLGIVNDLIAAAEDKIKRLAAAFGEEKDPVIAGALRSEMKLAGSERKALEAERETLAAEVAQGNLTEAEINEVLSLAEQITDKLIDPTLEQKRGLLNLLDVQVKLGWKESERGLWATCALTLKRSLPGPKPNVTSSKDSNGTWLPIPAVGGTSSSTTMT